MRAIGYLRVSTEGQVGPNQYGIDSQRDSIELCANSMGYDLVGWYEDAGISGATLDRPGLQSLLHDAALRRFQVVLVAKLDRLNRDLMGQLWIEKELLKAEVRLESVAEPFNGQDPVSKLFRQMIGAFAEFEKSRITERLSSGRRAKARTGGYSGGRAPLGYTAKKGGKSLALDPESAKTVQRVFALRQQGISLQAIADTLNNDGYTTAKGTTWRKTQVVRVLEREPLYRGEYRYADVAVLQGKQESILN
jgi:site-specific DNA recombinase